ncbi:hypothetical protein [Pseudoclavibacter helvolus]|uniref:hypothetical protein n=1 Tax=Pseudoclavibacter helvolus TaxID=255205 RepID=UPI003C7728CA
MSRGQKARTVENFPRMTNRAAGRRFRRIRRAFREGQRNTGGLVVVRPPLNGPEDHIMWTWMSAEHAASRYSFRQAFVLGMDTSEDE